MTQELEILTAVAGHGVIGYQGDMPWRGELPADMDRFKELTVNETVIMGKNTYISIPKKFRPLPKRRNIVVSSTMDPEEGMEIVRSLDEAVAMSTGRVFAIGGVGIYKEAMEKANILHITRIYARFPGDTYFPDIDSDVWELQDNQIFESDEKNKHKYSFETWTRITD